jgi:hypothetical protein
MIRKPCHYSADIREQSVSAANAERSKHIESLGTGTEWTKREELRQVLPEAVLLILIKRSVSGITTRHVRQANARHNHEHHSRKDAQTETIRHQRRRSSLTDTQVANMDQRELVSWQSIHHHHLLTGGLRCIIREAGGNVSRLRNAWAVGRRIARSHGSTGSALAWRTTATVAAHWSVAATTTTMTEQTATAQGTDHQKASTNACKTRHQRASGVLLRIQQQGGMVNGRDPKRTNLRHRNTEFLVQPQIREKKSANIREERTRGDLNCRNHSSSERKLEETGRTGQ